METYREKTGPIQVSVTPEYLPSESDPAASVYAFAYTVELENDGPEAVQLLKRHWIVTSGGELFTEVQGDGVVGLQPALGPGDAFQYTSWTVIKDPVGSMSGIYTFLRTDGTLFDVKIPSFDLVHREAMH